MPYRQATASTPVREVGKGLGSIAAKGLRDLEPLYAPQGADVILHVPAVMRLIQLRPPLLFHPVLEGVSRVPLVSTGRDDEAGGLIQPLVVRQPQVHGPGLA